MELEALEALLVTKKHPWELWQKKFVQDESSLIVLKMGRKSGKTFACAFKIVLDILNHDFSHTDGILILSRGQRQASEIFATVKNMLQKTGIVFRNQWKEREAYASRTKLILPNGNKIYCLPAGYTGDTLRTYSFWKIIYDEAAYIPDDVYVSTDACLAVYGTQEIYASTPDLSSGKFYDIWHTLEASRYEKMTKECGLVSPDFLARKRQQLTKLDYQREYEGKFVEAAEGLFSRNLLAAITAERQFNYAELFSKSLVFLGIDFARFGKDDNVIAFCHWIESRAYVHVEVISSAFRTTHITGKILALIKQHPNIKMVITDETGVGAGATDSLVESIGKRRVIGIANQKKGNISDGRPRRFIKVDLYTNLIRLMENGRIVLDADIRIIRSLKSMRYSYTSQGDLTIYGHDSHIAEAIVRAVFPLMRKKWRKEIAFAAVSHKEPLFAAMSNNLDSSWEIPGMKIQGHLTRDMYGK